ncbi:MAG: hypothetical protein Q8Q04_02870 [archaeon]|nr:hypothetical protein [archaeon]
MGKGHNWMIEMREVYLIFGFLLLIISYFKDNFDFFGYYFVFGAMIVIFSVVLYALHYLDQFN